MPDKILNLDYNDVILKQKPKIIWYNTSPLGTIFGTKIIYNIGVNILNF